jgi:hypothetical protein
MTTRAQQPGRPSRKPREDPPDYDPGRPFRMPREDPPDFDPDLMDDDDGPRRPLSYNEDFELPPVHNRQPTVPPVGVYIVQVDNIYMEEENRYNPDMARLRFEWRVLKVIDADDRAKADSFVNQIVHSWCNMTMGPKATLRAWSETLLQRTFEDEEQPDKRDLIGKIARASYVEYTKANQEKGVKLGNLSAYRRGEPRPGDAAAMSGKPVAPTTPAARTAPPRQPTRPATQAPAEETTVAQAVEDAFTEPWDDDEQ